MYKHKAVALAWSNYLVELLVAKGLPATVTDQGYTIWLTIDSLIIGQVREFDRGGDNKQPIYFQVDMELNSYQRMFKRHKDGTVHNSFADYISGLVTSYNKVVNSLDNVDTSYTNAQDIVKDFGPFTCTVVPVEERNIQVVGRMTIYEYEGLLEWWEKYTAQRNEA